MLRCITVYFSCFMNAVVMHIAIQSFVRDARNILDKRGKFVFDKSREIPCSLVPTSTFMTTDSDVLYI